MSDRCASCSVSYMLGDPVQDPCELEGCPFRPYDVPERYIVYPTETFRKANLGFPPQLVFKSWMPADHWRSRYGGFMVCVRIKTTMPNYLINPEKYI